mgnify:CR=1 FL=1
MKKIVYCITFLGILSNCGVPQEDYDKLQNEKLEIFSQKERLLKELDECQNGAERIIAEVEKAYSEKSYSDAKSLINKLYNKHPQSPKNAEFKELLKKITKEEDALRKKEEEEEKERIRLANLNNTGMWTVRYYVDEFGDPTSQGYISNTNLISGTFSNSATQNSDLNVRFLISNSSDISIKLFEYARKNPVKAYSAEDYRVRIRDKDGKKLDLIATNYSDRLSFNKSDSRRVHNALIKGGYLKFNIYEMDTPINEYNFNISKADWYENAYRKLTGK